MLRESNQIHIYIFFTTTLLIRLCWMEVGGLTRMRKTLAWPHHVTKRGNLNTFCNESACPKRGKWEPCICVIWISILPLFLRFLCSFKNISLRRVWRYQRGIQKPYIEEEQSPQWPTEKVQKDKQRSTKHAYKSKDRVTPTPLKTGGELRCSGSVSSSCSTSGTRRVNLVTNPVIRQHMTTVYTM